MSYPTHLLDILHLEDFVEFGIRQAPGFANTIGEAPRAMPQRSVMFMEQIYWHPHSLESFSSAVVGKLEKI
jgi:hypothetical protein